MKRNNTQIDALAGFLSALDFTHFCTFTSRKPISVASTRRIAEQVAVFVKALPPRAFDIRDTYPWDAKSSHIAIFSQIPAQNLQTFEATSSMFWAAEKFDTREGYHFHALISTPLHAID